MGKEGGVGYVSAMTPLRGLCRWAEGRYKLWLIPHNQPAPLLRKPVLTMASIENNPCRSEPMGMLLRLEGGFYDLPVRLMELEAHLLWLGSSQLSAMMSSETMPLFSDYKTDNRCTRCHSAQAVLIFTTDLWIVLCTGCIPIGTVSVCVCVISALREYMHVCVCVSTLWANVSVQYVCVIGAGRMGDERAKTWVHGLVFPVCRWIMTAAGLSAATGSLAATYQALTPHYIYGNSGAGCLYLHT